MKVNRLAVCGLGKLGLPIAAVFASCEVPVIGFDVDSTKLSAIRNGNLTVYEPELAEYLALPEVKQSLRVSESAAEVVQNSEACIFVTPTPSQTDGSFDHHYLLAGINVIAQEVARQHKRNYLFIISSTVMPGACLWEISPILNRFLVDLRPQLTYKPEFIALGTVIRDLHYPSLTLIGEESELAGERTQELYSLMTNGTPAVRHMSLTEAELAKISLNCAVTMKISFANQVGLVAQKLGADPSVILEAIGNDPRIGHASLRFGLPFGGPCFPRDNRMFQRAAQLVGVQAPLAIATDVVNRQVLRRIIEMTQARHGNVGILGMAYKPATSVMEESPGLLLRRHLTQAGRKVYAHDVMASHTHTIEQVLECAVIVVTCDWPEYRRLPIPENALLIDPMGVVRQEQNLEAAKITDPVDVRAEA